MITEKRKVLYFATQFLIKIKLENDEKAKKINYCYARIIWNWNGLHKNNLNSESLYPKIFWNNHFLYNIVNNELFNF